jgi:chromosome segregation ATPase
MLDELQGEMAVRVDTMQVQDVQKAKANAAHLMQVFDKRIQLLRVALEEINRQVSAHCAERGTLLSFIIDDLMSAFNDIPKQYNSAIKILKKEVDQLRVALNAKSMELDAQGKDLNEQISLMQLERKMEKDWHAQLEEQLKKWKSQVDSYKKKAQDQIRIEREMLEHQLSGLREVIGELRLENDALKEQLQFQRSEMMKTEKKYAEFEQQIQAMNQKNEKLQLQISRGGGAGGAMESSRVQLSQRSGRSEKTATGPGPELNLAEESKLRQLLIEFPSQRDLPDLTNREITQKIGRAHV